MSTVTSAGAICGGNYIYRQKVGQCYGLCGIKDSALVVTEGSPWYSPIWHCTNCGDTFSSEGLGYRPFARGWRQEAIARAVRMWEAGCTCPIERDDDLYPIPCRHSQAVAS